MKINELVIKLSDYIGSINIKKVNEEKYIINTNLMLLNNFDVLKIYLISVNEEFYFCDYGDVFNSVINEHFGEFENKFFNRFIKENNIEFEDNRFLMKINPDEIIIDYNKFIRALLLFEMINGNVE